MIDIQKQDGSNLVHNNNSHQKIRVKIILQDQLTLKYPIFNELIKAIKYKMNDRKMLYQLLSQKLLHLIKS